MEPDLDTNQFSVFDALPDTGEFVRLREQMRWGCLELDVAARGLGNSLYRVTVREQGLLVGMGRVVGDGAVSFYLQDVAVDPSYQGRGIGTAVMRAIERYLDGHVPAGAMVGLMAAKGKEAFYARFGYAVRDGEMLGCGMSKTI